MPSSNEEVAKLVTETFSNRGWDPLHNRQDPRYAGYIGGYLDDLREFDLDVLQQAMGSLCRAWKGRHWPNSSHILEHVDQVLMDRKTQAFQHRQLARPEDRAHTPESRRAMQHRLRVLWQWYADGTVNAGPKQEVRAALEAEARRRMEQNSREAEEV